ncbi:MAG TPA: histidine phosphatase family protein [Bacteroides sp.]|nr:histidine phosphatase family protein [Bacteroides sp.]
MERKLFIIRHGKSSWEEEGLDDIDRPLADRGIRNADTMAHRLRESGDVPELIFTSPANRALNTAMIMARVWGLPAASLEVHDALYMAYESDIDAVVGMAPDPVRGLAIFGHNPSFTLYANRFLDTTLDNLPTAGVVIVTLESDGWSGIGRPMVINARVEYPRRKP